MGEMDSELLFDLPAEKQRAVLWNPWHGCLRYSESCRNCYVYRIDAGHGKDASIIRKTKSFDLPLAKNKAGRYKLPYGSYVYLCFSSDFFIEEADRWRRGVWEMIRLRKDLNFFLITKRISRAADLLPSFWQEIMPRVQIACTMEDQRAAEQRLAVYKAFPAENRVIICEPLLGNINFSSLEGINRIIVGGESGPEARICEYEWVLNIRQQCLKEGISFHFRQTGAKFKKNGKVYSIPRKIQHEQAGKAGIDIL